jgi:hypothetical protein
VYGSWFLITGGIALVVVALVGITAAASPLFAIVFFVLALALIAAGMWARRSARASAGGDRGPGPQRASGPRSDGAPASGEGAATAGEAATPRR